VPSEKGKCIFCLSRILKDRVDEIDEESLKFLKLKIKDEKSGDFEVLRDQINTILTKKGGNRSQV
jgi:hypothetical protein